MPEEKATLSKQPALEKKPDAAKLPNAPPKTEKPPPRRSHTVIPLPAFVQSEIVFSVCGLSIQTRSAPFRTIPE